MHEVQMHTILSEHPDLVEAGLTFVQHEVPMGHGLRCDLLFRDCDGRDLFVEVKWTANRRAVVQVEHYELLRQASPRARFVLVATDAKPGIAELLARRGFELKLVTTEAIRAVYPEFDGAPARFRHASTSTPRRGANNPINDRWKCVLSLIQDRIGGDLPGLRMDHGPNGRERLLIPRGPGDYYVFSYSGKVKDAFRCSFVADLDQKFSPRRESLQLSLLSASALNIGVPIENQVDDTDLAAGGLMRWAKISRHRWHGVHTMNRIPDLDLESPESVAAAAIPAIREFIKVMQPILEVYCT